MSAATVPSALASAGAGGPAGPLSVLRPDEQPDCPSCSCCTAALCAKGATHELGCVQFSNPAARETVRGCPCSAPDKSGTVAHRTVLELAVQHAAELPLDAETETVLRQLAGQRQSATARAGAGTADSFSRTVLRTLRTWRYVTTSEPGELLVTDAGRRYLAARAGGAA
ncbi:hypothetical protein OG896_24970 [Streptomyces sp. NBC_00669]|uniref:hypothetical protein n=1 Tax=Streptomyces sp. NBC_00669 TaxID=2976011 RepID=UPI002E304FCD|nr:hypothetical protein [Streptomyces sp. NBC_00669]